MDKEKGIESNSEREDTRMVVKINGEAPNSSVNGFHVSFSKELNPTDLRKSKLATHKVTTNPKTIPSTNAAEMKRDILRILSKFSSFLIEAERYMIFPLCLWINAFRFSIVADFQR